MALSMAPPAYQAQPVYAAPYSAYGAYQAPAYNTYAVAPKVIVPQQPVAYAAPQGYARSTYAQPLSAPPAPAPAPLQKERRTDDARQRQIDDAKRELRKQQELAAIREQAEHERRRLAGEWPEALRKWLERSLAAAATQPEEHAARLQNRLKSLVEESIAKGDLWTRDWNNEPVAWLPSKADDFVPVAAAPAPPRPPPPPPPQQQQHEQHSAPVAAKPVDRKPDATRANAVASRGADVVASASEEPVSVAKRKAAPSKATAAAAAKKKKEAPPAPVSTRSRSPEEDEQKLRRAERFNNEPKPKIEMTAMERTLLEAERVALAMRAAKARGAELNLEDLVILGTSTALEKPYLRLTSAPDPATIRPVEVLARSLALVQARLDKEAAAAYTWASEQLKSIRQDLSVQHVKSPLTVLAYETHARAALVHGPPDFHEFNQCVTQLMELYRDGLCQSPQNRHLFNALQLLYNLYAQKRFNARTSALAIAVGLKTSEQSPEEELARRLWEACELSDVARFERLYAGANALFKAMLGPLVPCMHHETLRRCFKAARTLPVANALALLHVTAGVFASYKARFGLVMADRDVIDCKASLNAMQPYAWDE